MSERPVTLVSLATLRDQLAQAEQAYPELRRGLRAALVEVERVLGQPTPPPRRDRRRVEGLR